MAKKLRVALIYGGTSEERKVSIQSAGVVKPILEKKYDVVPVEIAKDGKWLERINKLYKKIDVAFLMLHGPGGEDGTIQGVLELLGIKYTGSKVLSSAIAMDKAMTKKIVASAGILVAPHIIVTNDHDLPKIKGKLVVKPNRIGSSVGVTISDDPKTILKGIKNALKQDNSVLIEPYVKGREFTVPVLGNDNPKALPVIEIIPKVSEFFDFRAKYEVGGSDEIVPARISKSLAKNLQNIALAVHQLLECRGVTRSDFIVTDKGKIYFLEINTIPGMTTNSLVPKSAMAAGITFPKLLDKLIELGKN